MKFGFLCMFLLASICLFDLSFSVSVDILGGIANHKAENNVEKAKEIMIEVSPHSAILKSVNRPDLIYYGTQVVAGINYYMVYQYRQNHVTYYQCLIVFQHLYSQPGPL